MTNIKIKMNKKCTYKHKNIILVIGIICISRLVHLGTRKQLSFKKKTGDPKTIILY
jgi:preprotein translocase subunit Sec63